MEYVDLVGTFADMPLQGFTEAIRTHHARRLAGIEQDRGMARGPIH
jgi:hypothetical protein